jgi:hypothetical protein
MRNARYELHDLARMGSTLSAVSFEPFPPPRRLMSRSPRGDQAGLDQRGRAMHTKRAFRINCDLGSFAALVIGIGAVSFLALNGF